MDPISVGVACIRWRVGSKEVHTKEKDNDKDFYCVFTRYKMTFFVCNCDLSVTGRTAVALEMDNDQTPGSQ